MRVEAFFRLDFLVLFYQEKSRESGSFIAGGVCSLFEILV